MSCAPPLWIVLVVQGTSVIGDTLGQRSSRKYYKKSTRKMLFSLTVMSGLQILIVLLAMEYISPSITSQVYVGNQQINCTQEVDIDGRLPQVTIGGASYDLCNTTMTGVTCHPADCPSQGPIEMWTKVLQHPFLWWNCLVNIGYYVGEVLLYQEAFGLVFLVLASLTSSFCIAPLEGLFGLYDSNVPPVVLILGIIGAMLCVIEKPVHTHGRHVELRTLWTDFLCLTNSSATSNDTHFSNLEALDKSGAPEKEDEEDVSLLKRVCTVTFPFILLSFLYSFWFTTQKIVNDTYHMNVWGFTSWDQVVAPVFMMFFLLSLDIVPPFRALLFPSEGDETTLSTMKASMKDTFAENGIPFLNLFVYRFMINCRAIAYFYLGTSYDLSAVYVELQMTRVILSWLVSCVGGIFFPEFIQITEHERLVSFSPFNILLKMMGTVLMGIAIFVLQASQSSSGGSC